MLSLLDYYYKKDPFGNNKTIAGKRYRTHFLISDFILRIEVNICRHKIRFCESYVL